MGGLSLIDATWFLPVRSWPANHCPALEHDPEKCEAVFRKDHAQTKPKARIHPFHRALAYARN
jgi:hypothetical protein